MLTTIIKIALQILAGVGIGELADKVLPNKVPTYPTTGLGLGFSNIPRLVWIIVIMIIGAVVLKFIGRKAKITILK